MNYYNYWKPRRLGAYTRRVHRGEQLRVFNGVGMLAPSPQTCWYILCWKSCWLTPWCLAVIGLQIRMMNLASGSKPLLYVIFWISQNLSTICLLQYDTGITIYAAVVCHFIILYHCLSIRLILFSPISSNKNLQVRRFKFHLPDYYVALVRALLTLEGIALAADCHLMKKLGLRCTTSPRWVSGGSTMLFF